MKKLELYDIITLEDKTEYTVLKIITENTKTYCLLAPIDETEEVDMENIKIVEIEETNKEASLIELDNETTARLAKKFLNSLRESLE